MSSQELIKRLQLTFLEKAIANLLHDIYSIIHSDRENVIAPVGKKVTQILGYYEDLKFLGFPPRSLMIIKIQVYRLCDKIDVHPMFRDANQSVADVFWHLNKTLEVLRSEKNQVKINYLCRKACLITNRLEMTLKFNPTLFSSQGFSNGDVHNQVTKTRDVLINYGYKY
jgi:hypothetical protein